MFNMSNGEALTLHLKEKDVDVPFRVDFSRGRKKNYQGFYTFLGHDALAAWKEYFEIERGYPKKGEPCAIVRIEHARDTHDRSLKRGVSKFVLREIFKTLKVHAGLNGNGITIHGFRHVARSTLQLAKKDGFDETCCEFWMGHRIDPLGYNKFTELNPEYVLENYHIAENYLNILTGSTIRPEVDTNEIVKALMKHPEMRQFIRSVTQDMDEIARLGEKEKVAVSTES
jgi:hypothetical protein